MRFRLASLLVALIAVGAANAATGAPQGPTGLRAFVLEADEPSTTTFHRTPSFAWNPVPGAVKYQFQLSMSSPARDNAVFYNTNTLASPVVAPPIRLPWIGPPYALYARVRATLSTGDVTAWSAFLGFNVTPPAAATPLPSDPGLLRWTPVDGATSYQIWLIDVPGKDPGVGEMVTTHTNVMDEREYYTFHQSTKWIGTVRWRIRAARTTELASPINSFPLGTSYTPWSPIYTSTNPAVTGGAIKLLHTISDITNPATATKPNKLMPAFTWTGNQTITGQTVELYRVYAFTDQACNNVVYSSPVVGGPSYAPRTTGGIALPGDSGGIGNARSGYLPQGASPPSEMYDGTGVTSAEDLGSATPTTAAPPDFDPGDSGSGVTPVPGGAGGTSGGTGGSSGSSSGGSSGAPPAPASPGAPVDLWDTDLYPKSGYFWTVVGVGAIPATASASTVAAPGASMNSLLVPVADVTKFQVGESITIGNSPDTDTSTIGAIGNGLLTLTTPLSLGHAVGEPVSSTASSGVIYRDLELPQDACAQREGKFGIASEPALTSGQNIFATGLSPTGHLYSAAQTASFYGAPLIAWPSVLAANRYEIEWSSKEYPFVAAGQLMTASTSVVLPVSTGTWYYRIRGFDDNLPTGAQMLSWSDTEKLVIAGPTFKVVKAVKPKFKIVGNGK